MDTITQMPDIQQQVLRTLFFSPDHTATPVSVAERIIYPDHQVDQAILQLERLGHIRQVHPPGDTVKLRPSEAMLAQMRLLNSQADAQLRGALGNAKRLLGDE